MRLISLAGLMTAAFANTALAQSQPVAWSPSYIGACADCDLSGRNLAGWTLNGANYSGARFDYAFMRGVRATAVNM